MSKRAEKKAMEAYPVHSVLIHPARGGGYYADNHLREGFIKGYEQAEKDVWERIKKYLSNRNATDYATIGWILKNIKEYKKKIMEIE